MLRIAKLLPVLRVLKIATAALTMMDGGDDCERLKTGICRNSFDMPLIEALALLSWRRERILLVGGHSASLIDPRFCKRCK